MTVDLVWYAAFGSNLSEARFLTYLTGGQVPGSTSGRVQDGARDPSPPSADQAIEIDRTLFFARTSTQWGGGGVAFLDPDERPQRPTLGRAWLIRLEQFEDVYRQENGHPELTPLDLQALRTQQSLAALDRPYGNLLHLGYLDGHDLLTFTCRARPQTLNPAHESYLGVIATGLRESHGLSPQAIADYFACLPQPALPSKRADT